MLQTEFKLVDTENDQAESLFQEDVHRCLHYAHKAEIVARAVSYHNGLATSLYHQTRCHHSLGDYYQAIKAADECLTFYQKADNVIGQIHILKRASTIYSDLGDLSKGLNFLLEALDLARAIKSDIEEAQLLFWIGVNHSILGEHQKAVDHYLHCIKLFEALGRTISIANAYNSCCVDLARLSDFETAKFYGEKAVELFSQEDHIFGAGVATSSLGEVYLAEEDYATAKEYFENALVLCSKKQETLTASEVNETLLNLGRAHFGLNQTEEALKYANLVLDHAEKNNIQPLMMKSHHFISTVYEKNEEWSKALSHLKKYVEIQENLTKKNKNREIANLQVLHKTNEAHAEAERQKILRENDRKNYERVSKIKDDFLHNATHDIKNPLLIINTSTHLLRKQYFKDDERFHRYLNQIDEQSKRILQLVQDILDLAELESAPLIISETQLIQPWLTELIHRFEPLAEQKNIQISCDVDPADLAFRFSKQRLSQSIENLISNSIKYTPKGGAIFLKIEKVKNHLQISVKDTGVGIAENAIPNLFNRFYRAPHNSDTVEGTGLGLYISKLIVEQHGGTIDVESKLGKGSIFTIKLPMPKE